MTGEFLLATATSTAATAAFEKQQNKTK